MFLKNRFCDFPELLTQALPWWPSQRSYCLLRMNILVCGVTPVPSR